MKYEILRLHDIYFYLSFTGMLNLTEQGNAGEAAN